MTYVLDAEQWNEAVNAVTKDEIKLPDRPIDIKATQAETLMVSATEDQEALEGAGLDWTYVEDLATLPGALRYFQAEWMSEYRARKESQKDWNEQSPAAYELRSEMLHHFSFAYRDDFDLNTKVVRIREGNSQADMVQDLLELAVLAENNPTPLAAINYDTLLNEQARSTSHNMAELLAQCNGSVNESSVAKLLRDKAFTLLDERMRKIREVGQYIFWRDAERKALYVDDYN